MASLEESSGDASPVHQAAGSSDQEGKRPDELVDEVKDELPRDDEPPTWRYHLDEPRYGQVLAVPLVAHCPSGEQC